MHRYKRLMVGLSRTGADVGLLRYAAMVARLGTASEVRFVHVLPNSAAQEHDRVTAELQADVRPYFAGVPETTQLSYDVLQGPLVDRMLAHIAERQIDLLLVGHGLEPRGRRRLARRLAMNAPCSIWMVPSGAPADLQRILIPIDFSEHAADSLRVGTSMARLSGHAECLALHAYFDEAVVTYEGYEQIIRGQEERAYQSFVAPIDCQGVKVTPLFEEGVNVSHVINRVAERHRVDLIVMATRGRSQSAGILLGSVTEEVIIDTRVPLLAVKHYGARINVLQAILDRRFWHGGELHTD